MGKPFRNMRTMENWGKIRKNGSECRITFYFLIILLAFLKSGIN
jgi:hypothetical protein